MDWHGIQPVRKVRDKWKASHICQHCDEVDKNCPWFGYEGNGVHSCEYEDVHGCPYDEAHERITPTLINLNKDVCARCACATEMFEEFWNEGWVQCGYEKEYLYQIPNHCPYKLEHLVLNEAEQESL